MAKIEIKKLTKEYVNDVFDIEKSLLGNVDKISILKTIETDNLNYYLMFIDNEVIGFFECLIISPDAELYDIVVKEDYRRLGYGSLMLNEFEKLAKESNCNTLLLEVNKINKSAIAFYERAGFVAYSIRKNYYGDNDAILMKKSI